MKIISIETCTNKHANGYIDDGEFYMGFEVRPNKPPVFGNYFAKKEFKNLAEFAAILGKFDPDCFVLEKPIEIEELTFEKVRELFLADERFK
jgi:hypothetical protein